MRKKGPTNAHDEGKEAYKTQNEVNGAFIFFSLQTSKSVSGLREP